MKIIGSLLDGANKTLKKKRKALVPRAKILLPGWLLLLFKWGLPGTDLETSGTLFNPLSIKESSAIIWRNTYVTYFPLISKCTLQTLK